MCFSQLCVSLLGVLIPVGVCAPCLFHTGADQGPGETCGGAAGAGGTAPAWGACHKCASHPCQVRAAGHFCPKEGLFASCLILASAHAWLTC